MRASAKERGMTAAWEKSLLSPFEASRHLEWTAVTPRHHPSLCYSSLYSNKIF